ncbi:alpha/beta fold hydrolase [Terriglobus roseus]|uniref:Proline iminopeptidase n=1 Tax=Terriglobus roseus TaxID=392734 RepID=A0A1H4KV69_9BACT|nr:alpha/beta hydrolase [Terriglobus roseus]SEB62283.1 proline iminopeptidase [Terriglobus roseus]
MASRLVLNLLITLRRGIRVPLCVVLSMAFLCLPAALAQQGQGTFENAGLTLYYRTLGQGSPVLILAGGPGMDVDYMLPVARLLAKDHTAILLEQRGTGRSMPAKIAPETVSADLMLSDMEALRTKLRYRQWVVLGHSAGSLTAMLYAVAHPSSIRALVLLGTMPPNFTPLLKVGPSRMARLGPAEQARMAELSKLGNTGTVAQQNARQIEMLRMTFEAEFVDKEAGHRFAQTMTVDNFHMGTSAVLETALPDYDERPALAKLHIPTLIVQGRQDSLDPDLAALTRDAIPDAQLVIAEKAGHFGWLEQPEFYRTTIETFLRGK